MDWDLSSSLEDYIESILNLIEKNRVARVKDIASDLDVKKSSVTIALRTLAKKGYVNYEPYSFITLTESGTFIASCVRRRHRVLKETFITLFEVEESIADKAACEMEHGMKAPVYKKMAAFKKVLENEPDLVKLLQEKMAKFDDSICSGENCCEGEK